MAIYYFHYNLMLNVDMAWEKVWGCNVVKKTLCPARQQKNVLWVVIVEWNTSIHKSRWLADFCGTLFFKSLYQFKVKLTQIIQFRIPSFTTNDNVLTCPIFMVFLLAILALVCMPCGRVVGSFNGLILLLNSLSGPFKSFERIPWCHQSSSSVWMLLNRVCPILIWYITN